MLLTGTCLASQVSLSDGVVKRRMCLKWLKIKHGSVWEEPHWLGYDETFLFQRFKDRGRYHVISSGYLRFVPSASHFSSCRVNCLQDFHNLGHFLHAYVLLYLLISVMKLKWFSNRLTYMEFVYLSKLRCTRRTTTGGGRSSSSPDGTRVPSATLSSVSSSTSS